MTALEESMDSQSSPSRYSSRAGYQPDRCVAFYVITPPPDDAAAEAVTTELIFPCQRPRHRAPSEHEHQLPGGAKLRWPNPPPEAR
jgi:hypothetical protein